MTQPPYPQVDERAPCRSGDPDRYFPHQGANGDDLEAVKAECRACPFRDPCLAWALARERDGVWGGTTGQERKDMRRRLRIRLESQPHMLLMPDRSVTYRRRSA